MNPETTSHTWGNAGERKASAIAAFMAEAILSLVKETMRRQGFEPEIADAVVNGTRTAWREENNVPAVACEVKCIQRK